MKFLIKLIILFLFTTNLISREIGETEITTEDGIEVYQDQKYYLLKKNVKIDSDNFNLNADNVKIIFDKNLYDIIELDASGNVVFDSSVYNVRGSGEFLNFKIKLEELTITGFKSELFTDDFEMYSDGSIKIGNINGNFIIKGANSSLVNESIFIKAEFIDGFFDTIDGQKQISSLIVEDKHISYVKNTSSEMYAKKINFDNSSSLIELKENVTIIRGGEKITGDYGTLDTKNNSYKIKSDAKTKVKAIIQNNE